MCRQPTKIALNYLKTTFIIDLLAFFPFFDVFNAYLAHEDAGKGKTYNFYHLIYLLRLLRLYKAAELLKPNYVFGGIKQFHRYITEKIQQRYQN